MFQRRAPPSKVVVRAAEVCQYVVRLQLQPRQVAVAPAGSARGEVLVGAVGVEGKAGWATVAAVPGNVDIVYPAGIVAADNVWDP
jgi:hypothetical protein